ncbi:MAG: hypothetical protein HZB16_20800 [Armatimonadetes bacterium]|nr:hypothetical protein [Armatimonadota bacterium]
MRCALVVLFALSALTAEPSVSGVWRYRRADGTSEVLELIAGGRFVWRDDAGAAAGEMTLSDGSLRLRARSAERLLGCRLLDEGLELAAPAADPAAAMSGDLARMAPRVGMPAVIWRRPGWVPDPPEISVRGAADLAGGWRLESAPGRVDRLDLGADGFFTYTGPGGLIARGHATWRAGVIELVADGLTRRLAARLRLSNRAWTLLLRRMPDDRPEPTGDLAEMPPCLSDQAIWRRDLEPPAAPLLLGRFQMIGTSGLAHALTFGADGRLTIERGTRVLGTGHWRVDGLQVVLTVASDGGFDEVRHWAAQRLGSSLLVWRALDDAVGDRALTAEVPPVEGELARYDLVAAPAKE